MPLDTDILFKTLKLSNITLPNKVIRSATYEGMADAEGNPTKELGELYSELAKNDIGTIVTGFCYISKQGRAMHPAQCGIDTDDKIAPWVNVVKQVKQTNPDTKIFMQIAHTGRQTLNKITGQSVVGASNVKCTYFKQKIKPLSGSEINVIISDFANAALRAKQAGFEGVQVHAAHGYLIHQFLSPHTNSRKDKWADKPLLLEKILASIKNKCGDDFPIIVKLSGKDDRGLEVAHSISTIKRIQHLIDAVEISYGTMEYALNIIRGACPIDVIFKVNPMFNKVPDIFKCAWRKLFLKSHLSKLIPFESNYNLDAAIEIKNATNVPVILVGGIRNTNDMINVLQKHGLDAISMCRPFICEPDLLTRIRQNEQQASQCVNCNLCTVYCDSKNPLRCYIGQGRNNG